MALATLLFGTALWFRGGPWLWVASAVAGAVSLAAAFAAHPRCLTGLATPSTERVVHGVLGAALMIVGTYAAYYLAAWVAPELVAEAMLLNEALDAPPGRWAALPVVVLVVAAEEVVWRGLAVELVARPGRRESVVWAAALGLYVLPQLVGGSFVLILLAAVAGGVWTAQRLYYGNLVTPFLTHLLWDVMVFVVLPLDRLG